MRGYEQYWRQREFLYEFVLEMGMGKNKMALRLTQGENQKKNDLLKLFECPWETEGIFLFWFGR